MFVAGLVGLVILGPTRLRAWSQETVRETTSRSYEGSISLSTRHSEPPRVRAAREFLARRGMAPSSSRAIGTPTLSLRRALAASTTGTPVWTAAGPMAVNSLSYGLVTGRISSIAVDPSDATGNTVYLGTTGGGVWKSQNAASATAGTVQFLPMTDSLAAFSGVPDAGISVGAMAVQPGGTGVVLAGLGDPNDALDSYYGAGLLRSTDGGQTWSLIQKTTDAESGLALQDYSFIGEGFAGFAWSTTNTQLVVAAVSQAYEGTLVNAVGNGQSYEGLYWSNDSGATWHLARITDQDGADVQGPLDGFVQPDGNAATSVVWNPARKVFVAAVRYHGYYQSTDGMNWTQLPFYPNGQPGAGFSATNCPTEAGYPGVAGCPIFRGSLAVNPVTGDTFAWSVDEFNQDQGIWQDRCNQSGVGGACANPAINFATQIATSALETADENGPSTIENGDYNLAIAAVPSGQDSLIFAGDRDLWKCSLAGGCVWRNTTNSTTCMSAQVGEYQHGFAWAPGNPTLLYSGTDSGIWRSLDDVGETGSVCASTDALHWQNLNSGLGSLAEVGSLGQSASTAETMIAGLGANGVAGIVNAPPAAADWNEVLGGEGGPVAVDPTANTNSWYANNGAGVSIFHCTSATGCTAAQFGTTPAVGEAQVSNDGLSMPYPAEFRIDSMNTSDLLIGTCRVWLGPASGSGWTSANAISPILDGSGGSVCDGNAVIRSIAALPVSNGGEVIYVGMAGAQDGGGVVPGHVFAATVSAAGVASTWTDLTYSPVTNSGYGLNAFQHDVNGLYVDPHDGSGQTVYVTISGFSTAAEPTERVYRSTDGGAHWMSITSNLPDAPATAVVVDAQDPNTVYVGTDLGVFATRTVASCGGSSGTSTACWSAYGTGLPLAPVTTLVNTPVTASSQVVTAGTYGRGIWQIPSATAGTTLTTATVSPASLTFAAQAVGTSSAAQTITLKTTGTAALTVASVGFSGSASTDYTETDNCAGTAIAKNASCQLKISFAPTATGTRMARLTIDANVSGGQISVPLTGTGLSAANILLTPASLSFGTQQVGTTSTSQTISVQNTGGSTATISATTVSAPFKKLTSTCGSTLAANTACAVTIAFAPTQAVISSGTFTVTDSAGTQTAQLNGTGVAAPTDALSVTALNFPGTVLGQSSAPMTVTITNSGGLPLTSIGTSISTSTGSADFTAVNNCGSQLAANSSCTISVVFTPSVTGAESGTLVISDALKAQSVRLNGSGLQPPLVSVSATALSFGSEQINTSTAARTLTITNKGGSPLGQPGFSLSGVGVASFSVGTTTCSASLAANASCTVGVIFTPAATGATTATLTVTTTSSGVAPASVTLTGAGLSPPILSVSPVALNFGTVLIGDPSAPVTVQVTNIGQVAMSQPTFAISGISGSNGAQLSDFAITEPTDITACTGVVNPGSTCSIQVIFSPSVVGTETATLTVAASDAIPSSATVGLAGVGAPAIALQASVTSLNFPPTLMGTTASAVTATISNVGGQEANNLTLNLAGPYNLVPTLTTCGSYLLAHVSCTVGVSFTPTAGGNQPGTLTATVSNLGVSPLTISLGGSGIAVGGIQTNPTQMTFGSIVVGNVSGQQTLLVTNSGEAAMTGLGITSAGDFTITDNQCLSSLDPGASCSTGVEFTPSATGIQSGTITVSSASAGVSPAAVALTGNGIQPGSMSVKPAVLNYGTVTVGQTSPAQTVTVSNEGATALAGLQYLATGDYSLMQNNCGPQLDSGSQCTFTVVFIPTAPGTRIGAVTIQSTSTGFTPVVVGLTGTGLPTVQQVVTPLQISFGTVQTGTDSAAQTIAVSNPGTGTLQGLSFNTVAPFSVGSGNCGTSLASEGTCSVPVTFAPTVGGAQNGVVTVASTSLGVPAVQVAVSGIGQSPTAISVNPMVLSFPGTAVGTPTSGQKVTISNPGGVALSGLSLSITGAETGDFAISSTTCPANLAAGGSCSAAVIFTPTVVGGRQAFLSVSSTTPGAVSQTVAMTGSGLTAPILSVVPSSLTFGQTLIGQTSATQIVTVMNSGEAGIANLTLAVTPGFALDAARTTCTPMLSGGANCTVGVVFIPTTAGVTAGSFTASSAQSGGVGTIAAIAQLNGTGGLPPEIQTSPGSLVQFGTTGVGQTAQPVAVTISNVGSFAALTGLVVAVDGTGTANGFELNGGTCSATLAAGTNCIVNVTLTPKQAGALTGTLTISSTNGGAPVDLALAGLGFDFRIAVVGSSSTSVIQGQTGFYTLQLTTFGGVTGSTGTKFNLQCGSLPANASCTFNPTQPSVPANGVSGSVVLGITTGAPAEALVRNLNMSQKGLLLGGLVVLPFVVSLRKLRLQKLLVVALLLGGLAGGLSSCVAAGGGANTQLPLGGGTPPGSYPVNVSASANGVTHSATVTLVVN